jgi:hypothetical protein
MTQLVAKPIVKDQFWVIKDGDRKVGNVLANNNGYELILNGNHAQFENTHDIKEKVKIRFEPLKSNKTLGVINARPRPLPRASPTRP